MINKEKLLSALEEMPENFSAEELIERIVLMEKIERGLDDILKERFYTLEEIEAVYLSK